MIAPAAVRPGVGDLSLRHGMRLVSDECHVGEGRSSRPIGARPR